MMVPLAILSYRSRCLFTVFVCLFVAFVCWTHFWLPVEGLGELRYLLQFLHFVPSTATHINLKEEDSYFKSDSDDNSDSDYSSDYDDSSDYDESSNSDESSDSDDKSNSDENSDSDDSSYSDDNDKDKGYVDHGKNHHRGSADGNIDK